MNKITIIGDGITKDFYFTFPFFTKNDIIVEKNAEPATGYGIFCFQAGLNSDFPFVGGKVHFSKAPKTTDAITITRKLELNRHIDYQPTVRLNPTTVNQDMNFIIEILKDMQNILGDFANQYLEITNKESTQTLLTKIENVTSKINDVSEQIDDFGDVSAFQTSLGNLADSVDSLTTTVGTHTTNISSLQSSVNTISQNQVIYLPDYTATRTTLLTNDTWQTLSLSGMLHVNFSTTNAVSWLTVYLGNEDHKVAHTTQVNATDRGADVFFPIKQGQKIKLAPRGATVNLCEIIPFCE